MKTYMANAASVEKKWYVIDAQGKVLGRLASQVAAILRGKNKPEFTPHCDTGDYVIIINADKVVMTGRKWDQKMYRRHSLYIGGMKEMTYRVLRDKHPERMVEMAVKRMLPKNSLGNKMYTKLFVYTGPEHPHAAQMPQELVLNI
jgi:large subunit ribosomal protein L13